MVAKTKTHTLDRFFIAGTVVNSIRRRTTTLKETPTTPSRTYLAGLGVVAQSGFRSVQTDCSPAF